ncbi:cobalt-zinc-cadmium efflux system protein [Parabacteroides sp. PF5-5]|uniref:cation diffusion facilitator family transporter n=1 Tax=unclassified Parabacteroides TaxID=2649774 RepID=UPI00247317A7|nr:MULTISPECIES: cation diffusion facilitator family transporter [unclassified Parabacteroides]MDH6303791.1 cobalt-zinc-cadmium efflux system protein [Parabacteroides sp. PH5-39]MDH6314408.1 cobalt-zinc-cadmium efflux system protein [Parabacteroides sp. PF5-13]MDH6318527.1 cobalt-zinc-cadmium efflux system protein [Parabacteroides sp. PH5-13]MDH6322180.1 cobalt-zinc-cadmium efflux system protein [Parabacteroides sp. PH5-8]MDH6325740.1 cobalt-zinc-cadmium efflux system protein [Parabacteroides 
MSQDSLKHNHSHSHGTTGSGNIRLAFFLNLFFAIIELAGGLITNSVAILSDALHDFGDSVSLGIAWYLQKFSEKGRDKYYSYGYKRFSLLGALFISIILLVGSVFVIEECVKRILEPQAPNAQGMFLLSILGIIVNGAAVLRLKKGSSINERAVSLHMMEDVLGWIAVFIVSIVMMFVNLPILDPLLSIAISIWILTNVYRNLKDTFHILLQQVPQNIDLEGLEDKIRQIPGVLSLHDIHLWTLDGEENILTLHIVLADGITVDQQATIKSEVRTLCINADIAHATIEFEQSGELCSLADC